MKYVALLRGINVGGNNKVAMTELKACFEAAGLRDVITYINSGNVIFDSSTTSLIELVLVCENAIQQQFGFKVVCCVITAEQLLSALDNAPSWWGDGDAKHNAIFVIAPKTTNDIVSEIGKAKPEYEQIHTYNPIIFWTAPLATFSRTRYSKIVGTPAYQSVTIRNYNTTIKLAQLCAEI